MKALLLIILLAGHEGVRVSSSVPDAGGRSPLEAKWTKVNSDHCVWSLGGCIGRAGEACKYRPFALDRGPSCRLRNKYVLHDEELREKFLNLEMDLLAESATRFGDKCDENGNFGGFQSWECVRKLGHIIRALNFLVRMQGSDQISPRTYDGVIRTHIDKATAALSTVLKDNKLEYLDLANKIRVNAVEFAKDPVSSTGWIRDTVGQLVSYDETERAEGRNKVAKLQCETPHALTEKDLTQLRNVAAQVSANVDSEVESEAFQKLEEMASMPAGAESVATTESSGASISLLQKSEGLGIFPSKKVIVVLVEFVLTMLLIVTVVYSVKNQAAVPLIDFAGALAGQIATAAIVYFTSGVDFSATKSPPTPPPPALSSPQETPQANAPTNSVQAGVRLPPAFNPSPRERSLSPVVVAGVRRVGSRRKGSRRGRRPSGAQFGVVPM